MPSASRSKSTSIPTAARAMGVPNLVADCREFGAPACFLFSLGPDQTGRAITRVFRPGFFQKVSRTSVVQIYGVRTLLNGTLLPAPHIGRRNAGVMRAVRDAGFEVGIHCYNHYRWQDYVQKMSLAEVRGGVRRRARGISAHLRRRGARPPARPGWQSNARSRAGLRRGGLALRERHARRRAVFSAHRRHGVPDAGNPEHAADLRRADGPAGISRRHDRAALPVAAAPRPGRMSSRCTRRSRAWAAAESFRDLLGGLPAGRRGIYPRWTTWPGRS